MAAIPQHFPQHIPRQLRYPTESLTGHPIHHETNSSRRLPRVVMVHGHARPLIKLDTPLGSQLITLVEKLNRLLHGHQSYPEEEPHCCIATPLISLLQPDCAADAGLVHARWVRFVNHVLANLESPPSCLTTEEVDIIADLLREKFPKTYPEWQLAAILEAVKLIYEPYDAPDAAITDGVIARCLQGHGDGSPRITLIPSQNYASRYFNAPCSAGRARIITINDTQYVDIQGVSAAEVNYTCTLWQDKLTYNVDSRLLVSLGIHPHVRCTALRTVIDEIDTFGYRGAHVVKALEALVRHVATFLPVDVEVQLKRSEVRQLVKIINMRVLLERMYLCDGVGTGPWEITCLGRILMAINQMKDTHCLSHEGAVSMICFEHVHKCDYKPPSREGSSTERRFAIF